MTVYAALTVALIVVLATATTMAIYLGLLNWMGALYVVRCAECSPSDPVVGQPTARIVPALP